MNRSKLRKSIISWRIDVRARKMAEHSLRWNFSKLCVFGIIAIASVLLLQSSSIGSASAADYDTSISATIDPGHYWSTELNLTAGAMISFSVDFANDSTGRVLFMSAHDFADFTLYESTGYGSFNYDHHLSVNFEVFNFSTVASVTNADSYHLVVANFAGTLPISFSGHLKTTSVFGLPALLQFVAIVAIIVMIIVAAIVIMMRRKKSPPKSLVEMKPEEPAPPAI